MFDGLSDAEILPELTGSPVILIIRKNVDLVANLLKMSPNPENT